MKRLLILFTFLVLALVSVGQTQADYDEVRVRNRLIYNNGDNLVAATGDSILAFINGRDTAYLVPMPTSGSGDTSYFVLSAAGGELSTKTGIDSLVVDDSYLSDNDKLHIQTSGVYYDIDNLYGLRSSGQARITGSSIKFQTTGFHLGTFTTTGLGIFETVPNHALDVVGDVGISDLPLLVSDTTLVMSNDSIGYAIGGGTGYWSQTGNYVYPSTIGDSVGVGTATPWTNFEVNGGIAGQWKTGAKAYLLMADSAGGEIYKYDTTGIRDFGHWYIDGDSLKQIDNSKLLYFDSDVFTDRYRFSNTNTLFGVRSAESLANQNNSAFGYLSLNENTSYSNTVFGSTAARYMTGNRNVAIGTNAFRGASSGNASGNENVVIGNSAALLGNGLSSCVIIGSEAGYNSTSATGNFFLGKSAGYTNTTGDQNVYIGSSSGYSGNGGNNVFIGRRSGYNATGSSSIFIGDASGENETGSNLLYIENSNSTTPLIWGDFSNDYVNINGWLGIGTETPESEFNIEEESSDAIANIDVYSATDGHTSSIHLRKFDGTPSSYTGIDVDDQIGSIRMFGSIGVASTHYSFGIDAEASENWGATKAGANVFFKHTDNGDLVVDNRMIFDSTGNIQFTGDILPSASCTFNAGSKALPWDTAFVCSRIETSDNLTIGGDAATDSVTMDARFILENDIYTDRWENVASNTFLGVDVVGGDGITDSPYNNTVIGYKAGYDGTNFFSNTAIGAYSLTNATEAEGNIAIGAYSFQNLTTGTGNISIGANGTGVTTQDSLLFIEASNTATPLIWGDFAEDSIRLGGEVIFTEDITYEDTFWEDLRFPSTRVRQGVSSKPDFDTDDVALLFPVNDSSEKVYLNVQMPHAYKSGTNIEPHVHWQQESSDTVKFRIKYRLAPLGGAFGSWQYLESGAMSFTYSSGTLHQMVDFPEIDMTGMGESSMLDIVLYRIDAGGAGSLNADMLFKEFDIHYEIDKPGSDNEIP